METKKSDSRKKGTLIIKGLLGILNSNPKPYTLNPTYVEVAGGRSELTTTRAGKVRLISVRILGLGIPGPEKYII